MWRGTEQDEVQRIYKYSRLRNSCLESKIPRRRAAFIHSPLVWRPKEFNTLWSDPQSKIAQLLTFTSGLKVHSFSELGLLPGSVCRAPRNSSEALKGQVRLPRSERWADRPPPPALVRWPQPSTCGKRLHYTNMESFSFKYYFTNKKREYLSWVSSVNNTYGSHYFDTSKWTQ